MMLCNKCSAAMAKWSQIYSRGIGIPNIRLRFLRFVFRFLVFLAFRFFAM
jgi:hypothetical protein